MNKESIIAEISGDTGYRKDTVTAVVNSMLQNITWALSIGEQVQLPGFGTFKPKKRAARLGRNPHTGESVSIPSRVMPVFTAGESLKRAVIKECS